MKKSFSILLVACFLATVASATEQDVVNRSASIVREFRSMPERAIPRSVLRNARGVAILSVVKGGFIFSGKVGDGVVIARTRYGWSGPSFIGTGGAGWGLQIGGEVTDFVIVLNTQDAVRAFSRGGNITIGGDLSAAAGPIGRTAEGAVMPKAAIYTYSKSKGLFAGVSLEGAVVATRTEANRRYYRRPVTASDILRGRVAPPSGAAFLRNAL